MQGSIISDSKDLLTGNYLTSEESSLNILDPPSLYVENNYVELLNIYPEGVSVHYALNKTPTRDDSVLDKSTLLPSNGNYYFKAFGEGKESTSSICKINCTTLNFKEIEYNTPIPSGEQAHYMLGIGAYGKGIYVRSGYVNSVYTLLYSMDGITFTECNLNFNIVYIRYITFIKDIFLVNFTESGSAAYGDEACGYSYDGINWYKNETLGNTNFELNNSTTNGDIIVSFYMPDNDSGYFFYSYDGINFTREETRYDLSGTNESLGSLCYGNGLFIAAGNMGLMYYSNDGLTWETTYSNPIKDTSFNGIIFNENKFVILGRNEIYYSYDGRNWNNSLGDKLASHQKICYSKDFYIINETGIQNSDAIISNNGIYWNKITYDDNYIATMYIFNNILFVEKDGDQTGNYICQL